MPHTNFEQQGRITDSRVRLRFLETHARSVRDRSAAERLLTDRTAPLCRHLPARPPDADLRRRRLRPRDHPTAGTLLPRPTGPATLDRTTMAPAPPAHGAVPVGARPLREKAPVVTEGDVGCPDGHSSTPGGTDSSPASAGPEPSGTGTVQPGIRVSSRSKRGGNTSERQSVPGRRFDEQTPPRLAQCRGVDLRPETPTHSDRAAQARCRNHWRDRSGRTLIRRRFGGVPANRPSSSCPM